MPNRASQPTEPFFWRAGRHGCLLSHGLTGTPYEMRFVGEALHRAGFSVRGVALAGHVTSVEELAQCRWQDWYDSLAQGLDDLHESCDRVLVAGLSLGGLLTLQLARREAARVDAIALLSTPLVLGNPWPVRLASVADLALRLLPSRLHYVPKSSEIADPEARGIHPGYDFMPLPAVAELLRLTRNVRAALPVIDQPALVIQARDDPTAPLRNLKILASELPNVHKTVELTRSRHVITVDHDKELVAEELVAFAKAVLA